MSAASYWHGDVRSDRLSLYRAGLGALLCAESLGRLPYAAELFSSDGFHEGYWAAHAPSPAVAYALAAMLVVTSAAMTLGFWSRLSTALTAALWGGLWAIDQINEKALHTLVVVVMAMLVTGDPGARFSLDDRLRMKRGAPRAPETACAMPLRLLQLHFAQVYFFAGVVKIFAAGWSTGAILSMSLASRWATPAGLWLSTRLPDVALRALGLGTILFELLAPFLLFVSWARPWVIAVGLCFHLGIQLSLGIGYLGAHFILALLVLFSSEETIAMASARIAKALRDGDT